MDERSVHELFSDALVEERDSWRRWDLVTALHARGDEATFRAARELRDDPEPEHRVLAVDVLAQLAAKLGVPAERRPFRTDTVGLLLQRMPTERSPDVLASMASAWGHLDDKRSVALLHALRQHPDDDVRHSVVFGLLGIDDDQAVAALVELSGDRDASVRDWATFGLGTQLERDDSDIRDALIARLEDSDDDTREEALVGLARRGDPRAVPRLLLELDGTASRFSSRLGWLPD